MLNGCLYPEFYQIFQKKKEFLSDFKKYRKNLYKTRSIHQKKLNKI